MGVAVKYGHPHSYLTLTFIYTLLYLTVTKKRPRGAPGDAEMAVYFAHSLCCQRQESRHISCSVFSAFQPSRRAAFSVPA